MIKDLARKTINLPTRGHRLKKLDKLFEAGMPLQMQPALDFLITGHCDEQTRNVIARAEGRRKAIAQQGAKTVPIWYSPKPGSYANLEARPDPGKELEFTMEKVANTGKNERWGTVLFLITRAFESSSVFELGTCAGISAIYLSSASSIKHLITVEGSEALAEIARTSLQFQKNAVVLNQMFDDAIDTALPALDHKIDLAYIDGHHEKVATIHYFNRILPYLEAGAVVIFDDISWSYDMRDAWDILSQRHEFSHTLDLGAIGIGIVKDATDTADSGPTYWDLQPIVGKHGIGDPQGWKE